jgi:radical SAM superfamily enzyme YgiQ (UPF0313 family)
MSTLLLVSSNRLQRPYPVPPIGLAMLAERVTHSLGFEVYLFDAMFRDPAELPGLIRKIRPDYVGLGIRNVDEMEMHRPACLIEPLAKEFVEPIRSATDAPLILGGPGFSVLPRPIMELLDGDVGIVGEGEAALVELIRRIEEGRPVVDMPNVISRTTAIIPSLPAQPMTSDEIGPSRLCRWLDFDPYRARGSYPIQTKRGCTHQCIYCTYPIIEGRNWRIRSPESIVDEIAEASEALGDVTFEVVDSTFNAPPGHAEAVCRKIIDRGLGVRLRTMGINPAGVTDELMDLMVRAGFVQMDCTPDSAAPEVLKQLYKGFTRQQLESTSLAIRRAGIPCMWFFLFGGPRETEETFSQTLDFIDRFIDPLDMVYMAAGLRIYPGTPLYRLSRLRGLISEQDDLLVPKFFVSPELGANRCIELVVNACLSRPNCLPAWQTRPTPEILQRALTLRAQLGPEIPMFRMLIQARRELMGL